MTQPLTVCLQRGEAHGKACGGIAMHSGKTVRNRRAAPCLAATLHRLNTSFINAAQSLHEHSSHALMEARLLAGDRLTHEGDGPEKSRAVTSFRKELPLDGSMRRRRR